MDVKTSNLSFILCDYSEGDRLRMFHIILIAIIFQIYVTTNVAANPSIQMTLLKLCGFTFLLVIYLISSWSSFRMPRVEHTALPAPSVHHNCLQFTCVSQPCILQQVVNISHCLPSPVCMSIRWLPQDKFVGDFIIMSDTLPSEPHSSLLYFGG